MSHYNSLLTNLTVYGVLHFLIDCLCAFLCLGVVYHLQGGGKLIVLYNLLAFGSQPFWGLLSDFQQKPRLISACGCLLTCLAAAGFYFQAPLAVILLAGLGNAAFHIGSGSVCLGIQPRQAAAVGIYVAPGALGLFLGAYYSRFFPLLPLLAIISLIIIFVGLSYRLTPPSGLTSLFAPRKNFRALPGMVFAVVVLTAVTVAIRSFVGFALVLPWKTTLNFSLLAVLAAVCGKAFGGIFADRFGWRRVGVGGLLIALPLLTFAYTSLPLSLIGLLCFNFTMPLTMVHLSNLLPGCPGFAYGLSCLALILGALPTFYSSAFASPTVIAGAILAGGIALWLALSRSRPSL
jgi:FSR family fosmidomycin resistance protein-like MFS transporter